MANEKSRNRLCHFAFQNTKSASFIFPCVIISLEILFLYFLFSRQLLLLAQYIGNTYSNTKWMKLFYFFPKKKGIECAIFKRATFWGEGKGEGKASQRHRYLLLSRSILPAARFSRFPLLVRWASLRVLSRAGVCTCVFIFTFSVWPIQTLLCLLLLFFVVSLKHVLAKKAILSRVFCGLDNNFFV